LVEQGIGDGAVATWPPVSRSATGRQKRSVSAWIFVVRPPRERPIARANSQFRSL
jgi:hypothetical protein